MRVKDIVGLGVALVAAVAVAYGTRLLLTRGTDKEKIIVEEDARTVEVLVSGKKLGVGDLIDNAAIRWEKFPAKAEGIANYLTKEQIKVEDLIGSVVRDELDAGEPITSGDFVKPGDRSFLSAVLKPGTRAISINVNDASSSSGLIAPGDKVDVIVSRQIQQGGSDSGGGPMTEAQTVVQNVRLIALGKNLKSQSDDPEALKGKDSPKTATLEVSPEQAEAIAKAQREGDILLSVYSLESDPNPCQGADCPSAASMSTGNIKLMRAEKTYNVIVNER